MTAYITIRKTRSVELLVDGAVMRDNGEVSAIASKIAIPTGMRCAVTGRGPAMTWPGGIDTLATVLVRGAAAAGLMTFDGLIEQFADLYCLFAESCSRAFGSRAHHDLVLAGWSESRDVPETYVLTTIDGGLLTEEGALTPGVLHKGFPLQIGGPLGEWDEVLANGWSDPADDDALEARVHGLAILEAARATRAPLWPNEPDGPQRFIVGGFAELVTVTREGVCRDVIRRWPDRIGFPINPTAALPLPAAA